LKRPNFLLNRPNFLLILAAKVSWELGTSEQRENFDIL
jgi:hypothetical protein